MDGYVAIYRKHFDEDLWREPRTFSKWEAWMDMIQTAAFTSHSRWIAGSEINIEPRRIVASERFLATRWNWSRTKVRQFIRLLISKGRIEAKEPEKDHPFTVITVCESEICRVEPFIKEPEKDQKKTRGAPKKDHLETKEKEGELRKSKKERAGLRPGSALSDEDWLKSLVDSPKYSGIDVTALYSKLLEWCGKNKETPTRGRFLKWLAKEKPLTFNPNGNPGSPKNNLGAENPWKDSY